MLSILTCTALRRVELQRAGKEQHFFAHIIPGNRCLIKRAATFIAIVVSLCGGRKSSVVFSPGTGNKIKLAAKFSSRNFCRDISLGLQRDRMCSSRARDDFRGKRSENRPSERIPRVPAMFYNTCVTICALETVTARFPSTPRTSYRMRERVRWGKKRRKKKETWNVGFYSDAECNNVGAFCSSRYI